MLRGRNNNVTCSLTLPVLQYSIFSIFRSIYSERPELLFYDVMTLVTCLEK